MAPDRPLRPYAARSGAARPVTEARQVALDLAERLQDMGPVTVRWFFGGASLVLDGCQFAFVIKGALYLRAGPGNRALFDSCPTRPFTYEAAGRTVTVASYLEAPGHLFDDPDGLRLWSEAAFRAALSAKPRATR